MTEEEKPQILQYSPWIDGDENTLLRYFADCQCRTFSKGYVFYSQEENSDYVYLIHRGRVCLSLDNINGDAKDIFIADKGFIFGKLSFFDPLPNSCCAIVVSESAEVILIPKSRFQELLERDITFCREILAMMSKTIRTLISEIKLMSFSSSKAKVNYTFYHLINQYSTKEGDSYKINMTFTHQEIGELVGLSRVSVSYIISRMVKDGIIEKRNGYYYVKDKEAIYRSVADDEIADFSSS